MHAITVPRIPSANRAARAARGNGKLMYFKPKHRVEFEELVALQLPPLPYKWVEAIRRKKDLTLNMVFILSSNFYKRDVDNMPKVFIDCLAKRYAFNDSRIVEVRAKKRLDKTLNGVEQIMWEFV